MLWLPVPSKQPESLVGISGSNQSRKQAAPSWAEPVQLKVELSQFALLKSLFSIGHITSGALQDFVYEFFNLFCHPIAFIE